MTADLAKDKLVRAVPNTATTMPCVLCGAPVPHQRVEPFDQGKLLFRAKIIGPFVYVPAKHAQGGFCPDPDPAHARLWSRHTFDRDREARETYCANRRAAVEQAANGWKA